MFGLKKKEICTTCNTKKTRNVFEGEPTCNKCEKIIRAFRSERAELKECEKILHNIARG